MLTCKRVVVDSRAGGRWSAHPMEDPWSKLGMNVSRDYRNIATLLTSPGRMRVNSGLHNNLILT